MVVVALLCLRKAIVLGDASSVVAFFLLAVAASVLIARISIRSNFDPEQHAAVDHESRRVIAWTSIAVVAAAALELVSVAMKIAAFTGH